MKLVMSEFIYRPNSPLTQSYKLSRKYFPTVTMSKEINNLKYSYKSILKVKNEAMFIFVNSILPDNRTFKVKIK